MTARDKPVHPLIKPPFGRDEWLLGGVVLLLVGVMVWINQPTPDLVVDVTPVISRRQLWLPAAPKEDEIPPAVYAKAIATQAPQKLLKGAHHSKGLGQFAQKALPPLASVDLNRASAHQLEVLPHIGPKLAQRIVVFRKQHGAFKTVEALDEVKGVGPKLLSLLQPYFKPIPAQ
ncbi:MAG: helix-hairpin-helix domain-containing protein [Vampirovibrionales bacterium]|nr:helix-hairpin-helix domain-containing protein [Vampirovibrionales bacterium]